MSPESVAALKRQLRQVGARRTKQRDALQETIDTAKPVIIALHDAGVAQKEIAHLGGYNERAIHDILRAAGRTEVRKKKETTGQ